MSDGIMLSIGEDGIAREYDDTYDITIHCESQEEQNEVKRRLTVPHWIPVSERLPEANGRYLVTRGLKACNSIWNRVYIINYSDLMGLKTEKIWWNGNVGKSDFERIDDVLAWCELPAPYKEGQK